MKTWTWPGWLDNCAMVGGLLFFVFIVIYLLFLLFIMLHGFFESRAQAKASQDYAKQIEEFRNDFQ